jgi:hypothetical protein
VQDSIIYEKDSKVEYLVERAIALQKINFVSGEFIGFHRRGKQYIGVQRNMYQKGEEIVVRYRFIGTKELYAACPRIDVPFRRHVPE